MKKIRLFYLRWLILAVLFSFVLFASVSSEIGEWYAIFLYPGISKILSALSSVLPFSFDEWVGLGFVFLLLGFPFYSRKIKRATWKRVVLGELEIGLWIYVWFYWGWGMNYYRASFYQRAEVKPATYNEAEFDEFLHGFTSELNQAYQDCWKEGWVQVPMLFRPMLEVDDEFAGSSELPYTLTSVQDEIKSIFKKVPCRYGLSKPTSYQHPKLSSFNFLYSNVAVLGFMGPFFAESHVNHELSVLEYPFTYAHELSHLLGVSSEAEANLWAYTICRESEHPLIRLSGYLGMLSYVRVNANYLLPSAKFDKWESSLSPEILTAFNRIHAYWSMRYNHTLGEIQSALYTFYLKRNKISSGQKNYAQVVGMLLALPNFKVQLENSSNQ